MRIEDRFKQLTEGKYPYLKFKDATILKAEKRVRVSLSAPYEKCDELMKSGEDKQIERTIKDIFAAANEICSADTLAKAGAVSLKYGDVKEKAELLEQIQLGYFAQLKKCISPHDAGGATFTRPALIYGIRAVNRAFADLNFNANFSSLLFDLAAGVITENSKWKKLLV